MTNKKISIVMTTHNRNKQLGYTLDTITKSKLSKQVEVIIIDDNSKIPPTEIVKKYSSDLDIKLTIIKPEEKTYVNPCIPYNIGFSKATGDIVVIQNAEVAHIGDVLSFIHDNLKPNQYMCFGCYCLGNHLENSTFMDIVNSSDKPTDAALSFIKNKRDAPCLKRNVGGWYVNEAYFTGWNFLTAIYKKDLDRVGGFDPDFANGYCHDDDEFIRRIWFKKLNIIYPDVNNGHPFGVHLYHDYLARTGRDFRNKWRINNRIYKKKLRGYGSRYLTCMYNKIPHVTI